MLIMDTRNRYNKQQNFPFFRIRVGIPTVDYRLLIEVVRTT